jgi:Flp pilus assembly pilin Flp
MIRMLKLFSQDESGAVTVDWVVLTAAIVGLGLVVITTIRPGIENTATYIDATLDAAAVAGATGVAP